MKWKRGWSNINAEHIFKIASGSLPFVAYLKTDDDFSGRRIIADCVAVRQLFGFNEQIRSQLSHFLIGHDFSLVSSGTGGNRAVIGGLFGNQDAKPDENEAKHTNACPYSCDPIEALGGPVLRSPYLALGGLVIFLAAMNLSNRGLKRRPFGAQHIGGWFVAVLGGCLFTFAALPYVLGLIWPLI